MDSGSCPTHVVHFETTTRDKVLSDVDISIPIRALQGISSNLTAAKLWPSCVILSHFLLYHQNSIRGKNFFEFGSGYAVPSMVALRAGAKHAFLQELPIASLLEMQRQILLANGLEGSFDQVPFRWGQTLTDFHKTDHNIEFFIAADCIYDRQDFVAMIAEMMNTYKNAPLYMCYQDRNLTYSIDEEFELWKLKAILIPLKSFEFDAEKFLQKNSHTELMDEFPFEKIDSTLYMLEVRNADEPFEFEQK